MRLCRVAIALALMGSILGPGCDGPGGGDSGGTGGPSVNGPAGYPPLSAGVRARAWVTVQEPDGTQTLDLDLTSEYGWSPYDNGPFDPPTYTLFMGEEFSDMGELFFLNMPNLDAGLHLEDWNRVNGDDPTFKYRSSWFKGGFVFCPWNNKQVRYTFDVEKRVGDIVYVRATLPICEDVSSYLPQHIVWMQNLRISAYLESD